MKNLKLTVVLMCIAMVGFSSCGDDKKDDPTPATVVTPPTKKEIITAKTWKMSKIKADNIDITNAPSMAEFSNMRLKFTVDGIYSITTTSGTDSGLWEFGASESSLVFDPKSQNEQTMLIDELKDNSLKYTMPTYDANTQTITMVKFEMIYAQ